MRFARRETLGLRPLYDDARGGRSEDRRRRLRCVPDLRSAADFRAGGGTGSGARQGARELWRTRQFEYTWLRTAGGHYEDFWKVTRDALSYAAAALKVDLSAKQADAIMDAYLGLKAWPDARGTLDALKERGLRLSFLSNFTPHMLQAAIGSAGLD